MKQQLKSKEYVAEKKYWKNVADRFENAYKMEYNNTTQEADIRFKRTISNNNPNNIYDLDKMTYLDYEGKIRSIPSQLEYSLKTYNQDTDSFEDNGAGKYLRYTTLEDFYEKLSLEEMDYVTTQISGIASKE